MSDKPWVIAIVGPTAVGKTELAIHLAQRVGGEILSADSRLFYRGMDIGTAKPSVEERALVPHHLIDVADPSEVWSLSTFQKEAYRLIDEIMARAKTPFLVGGTGQYVRSIVEGWEIPHKEPDHSIRNILEKIGNEIGAERLYQKLQILDPEAAASIEYKNMRRTIRALEVILTTGEKFSAQRRKGEPKYRFWLVGLTRPRPELYQRIDERIDAMFASGLVAETETLLKAGISTDNPNLSAIGYREVCQYLQGEISLGVAKMLMKRKTREFVRRQANWFKPDDPSIHWYSMDDQTENRVFEDLRIARII